MKNKTSTLILGLSLALTTTFALAEQGVSDKEIVLGDVNVTTGPIGSLGYACAIGSFLAAAEANASGGVNGRMVRVISEDDGYVPTRTVQAVRKLIDVDNVFAMMATSGTANTAAALPILEEEKVPTTLNNSVSTKFYTPPRPYVFANGLNYADASYDMTRKMSAKKPGRWAAIFQDDDFGKDVESGFQRALKEQGGGPEPLIMRYKRGQTDFSAEVSKIKEAGDIANLFSGGIMAENVAILKELKLKGVAPAVGVLWTSNLKNAIELMGDAGNGIYIYDYVLPMSDPRMVEFDQKAKKLLKPDDYAKMNRYSVSQYIGAKAFVEAMRRCGHDLTRECTVAQLNKLKDYPVGTGATVSFTPDNHLSRQAGFLQVLDAKTGKLTVVD